MSADVVISGKISNYTILEDNQELTTNNGSGNLSGHSEDPMENQYFTYVLYKMVVPIIFGLITLIGTVGNILVIYVIFSRTKMRTVTNLLLLNLAFADLSFVVICPPFTAYAFAADQWQFGNIACKLMHYLLNVTVYVTIYTLVLISVIRYMTIVYSTQTIRYRTKQNIVLMCIAIWAIMLGVNIPILLSYGLITMEGGIKDCALYKLEIGKRLYATFFVFAYLLPLIVICILSMFILHHINQQKPSMLDKKKTKSDEKKKQASRLLILVVVIFAIFWLPVHIHLLVAYFGTISQHPVYMAISVLWNVLAYFNSCVNPMIYNIASKEFRDSFREVVFCLRVRHGHKGINGKTTIITKTTCIEANNGEMRRLVSTVKGDETDSTKL